MIRLVAIAAAVARDDTDAGQRQTVSDEHAGKPGGRCAERETDADLAGPLRDVIGDHAVDADEAEQQAHRASKQQHRERERRPRP